MRWRFPSRSISEPAWGSLSKSRLPQSLERMEYGRPAPTETGAD